MRTQISCPPAFGGFEQVALDRLKEKLSSLESQLITISFRRTVLHNGAIFID